MKCDRVIGSKYRQLMKSYLIYTIVAYITRKLVNRWLRLGGKREVGVPWYGVQGRGEHGF